MLKDKASLSLLLAGELIDRNLAASLQFKAGEHCQVTTVTTTLC